MARPDSLRFNRIPWLYLLAGAASLLVQLNPAWRELLLYDRAALERGELWRIWTGHWVHFGWAHFLPDTGLLLILGWLLWPAHARFARWSLLLMPAFISATIYWAEPAMMRYGGLSALDLGLLLYLAGQGWQRQWSDWFWPAVIAIYVGEVIFEIHQGGQGGGMIKFDDPHVQVATGAHLAAAAYAFLAWLLARLRRRSVPSRSTTA